VTRQTKDLSTLNTALDNINPLLFPANDTNIPIDLFNCSGPIAVFFSGDLTNYGGHINLGEYF
jgi:hypothetical protein